MQVEQKSYLNTISFLLLEPVVTEVTKSIIEYIEPMFNAKCRVEQLSLDLSFAYAKDRKQYNSTAILAYLKPITAKNNYYLAITSKDIYSKNTTFVFGEAEVGGRIGIVSLARLNIISAMEEARLLICKEVTHELGHILGLRHCKNKLCVMSFSPSLVEVEKKLAKFCPDCAHSLVYLAGF